MTQASSFRIHPRTATTLLGIAVLTACMQGQTVSQSSTIVGSDLAPAGAPLGTCWGKIPTPAVVETVTEQVLVTPAKVNADGTLASLPVFRAESRQEIVTPRTDRWFETPCPPAFTAEFVSTLQRALQARGRYTGPVNGNLDEATRRAVLAVQTVAGLPSDVLSIDTARDLGIVAVPRTL